MRQKFKYNYNNGDVVGNCIYLRESGVIQRGKRKERAAEFICPNCLNEFIAPLHRVKGFMQRYCGECIVPNHALTHGKSNSSCEYKAWQSMKQRCYNTQNKMFKYYGGIGITVCERWLNSFENFYEDMGDRPSYDHSLDRFPNKNGNYEPSNCRWATEVEQQNNKSNNVLITFNNKTLTVSQWSRETGINKITITKRIKRGWQTDKLFIQPLQ